MARLTGPDSGSRLAYGIAASGELASAATRTAIVYSDAGGTILADILTVGGSAIPGSVITVGSDSQLPLFQFPDSTDTVYVSVNGGPVTAVYARLSALQKALNLSDLPDKPTARTNLGLGSAATQPSTAFDAAGAAAAALTAAQTYTDTGSYGAWTAISSFGTNSASGAPTLQSRTTPGGELELRGVVSFGGAIAANATIFTLPVSPARAIQIDRRWAGAGSAQTLINITTGGAVQPVTASLVSGNTISFDSVRIPLAA